MSQNHGLMESAVLEGTERTGSDSAVISFLRCS